MRTVKFIKHINEAGMFKTPEQAKRQIERDAELGDEEIISKMAIEVITKRYVTTLKNVLKKRGINDFVFAYGFPLKSLFDIDADKAWDDGESYNSWIKTLNTKYTFDPAAKTITVDISFSSTSREKDELMTFCNNAVSNCVRLGKYTWDEEFINDGANYLFKKYINDDIKSLEDNTKKVKELEDLQAISNYTVKVNKVSLFAGYSGNIVLDFISLHNSYYSRWIDDDTLKVILDFLGSIFSFENNGNIYIKYYDENRSAVTKIL